MASVQGTHVFSVAPSITVTVSMSSKREGKSVYARWRAEISALTGAEYPYSITGTIVTNEYRLADVVTFKEAYPGAWKNPIVKYFPSSTGWAYVGEVTDPSVKTLPVRVRFVSNQPRTLHLEGEEEIPPFVLPTAPTSITSSAANIGNVSTNFTLSWSGQTAGTGTIKGYQIQSKIGSGSWKDFKSGTGTNSVSVNLSSLTTLARGNTVYFRVRLSDEFGYWSSYSTDTASVYYSKLPTAPTYVSIDKDVVANKTDNFTLSWSGAKADAGTITGYNIYYLKNGAWIRYTTVTGYSTTINLNNIAINRGDTISFSVTALSSLSLESDYSSMLGRVVLAKLPTSPTWLSASNSEIKRNDTLDVTWGGATAGTGTISYYILQYRRYHDNSWSDWTSAEFRTSEYCMCDATALFPDLQGGDKLDMRVGTVNSYDLQSSDYRVIASYISIKGGGIRIKVDGAWKEGTPWIKVNGTWKQGETYVNTNGNWREGI